MQDADPHTAALRAEAANLPIRQHTAALVEAVRQHRVVVVEGPTGCGKTTQLPRILLEAGLAPRLIGVTQPRRIAATSVALRIAAEEGVAIGEEVGYAIRFDDACSERTRIKVMTDGILLQEARTDWLFSAYDIIVVDEAHERTLNIDFVLGLLHEALTRRDDLKVILSSATIQPEVFQRFFGDVAGGDVPLVSIDARTHPVEVQHRPPQSTHPADVAQATADEVLRIHGARKPGAVLVFLSGEAMIRDTAQAIHRGHRGKDMVVLPLFGRLTREEQERVFSSYEGQRKVVLATNIAETSITIADVRYVVDTGLAKVPRVNRRSGLTALREEGISRASAEQRSGRAGRTAPGQAIRLYSARDLARRPQYLDEEITRLDLSDVLLRLVALGVSDVERFPFPTPPPRQGVRAALEKLESLGAIDGDRKLTPTGQKMIPFPLDPTHARMVVEAADRFPDVVWEVAVVGAFLSGRSPYLFPPGEEDPARRAHRNLAHPHGDAMTAVHTFRLWSRADDKAALCERNYLDPDIMAFIAKTHAQLIDIAERQGIAPTGGGAPQGVVRCVAAGFAHQFLRADGRVFSGRGDTRIAIHPSSALFGVRAPYVVAAEIVISARAYARQVSTVKPEWIVELAPDLARRWRLGKRGKSARDRQDLADVPEVLRLGEAALPVSVRRGEVRVDVPAEAAHLLAAAPPEELPGKSAAWKGRVSIGRNRFLVGMPLGKLIRLLAVVPLPDPDTRLPRAHFEGALLEADRNLHALEKHLDQLLVPMLPSRGRRAGWLMLVANGAEGYWYEVTTNFGEAVTTTVAALRDLATTVAKDDEIQQRIEPLITHMSGLADDVQAILRR